MYDTICYIYISPPLKSCIYRHGYEFYKSKGYEIKIYDLSPIVDTVAYRKVKKDLIDTAGYSINVMKSKNMFRDEVKKWETDTIAIPYFDFNLDYYFCYRSLSENKIPFLLIHRVNSDSKVVAIDSKKIKSWIRNISIHNLLNSIFIRIPKSLLPIRKAKAIAFGGSENILNYSKINLIDKKTKRIYIHALNYEDCIKAVKSKKKYEGEYAVFLDQYMPFHPDHINAGVKIDPAKYYQEIECLFEFIHEEYNYNIIIAAHPKADYEKYGYFSKWEKVKFDSANLVKNSSLVIANFSTAIAYVSFFKKKIIICDSDEFKPYLYFENCIKYWSSELGVFPVNLTYFSREEIKSRLKDEVDLNKYRACIRHTMKSNFEWDNKYEYFWDVLEREALIDE